MKQSNCLKYIILFILIVFLAATYRKFNFTIEQLSTNQDILIQNQIKLQAATQLLQPNQIDQLRNSALRGDALSMEVLSINYNRSDLKNENNRILAYVWGTLFAAYAEINNPTKKYQPSLSSEEIKTANKLIHEYKVEIDKNLKQQSQTINEATKFANDFLRSPTSIVNKTIKEL